MSIEAKTPFDPPFIETKSEKEWLRETLEAVRNSALLGYGALLAHNIDGCYDQVLKAMRDPLFPGDKQPGPH